MDYRKAFDGGGGGVTPPTLPSALVYTLQVKVLNKTIYLPVYHIHVEIE